MNSSAYEEEPALYGFASIPTDEVQARVERYTHVVYPTAWVLIHCECEGNGCLHCAGDGIRFLYPWEREERAWL